jgi:hypothetical protein
MVSSPTKPSAPAWALLLRPLRERPLLHVVVFVGLGATMNALGHALHIAWFRQWWQVVPCYLGYVLPLALIVRPLPLLVAWRTSILAFIPLELCGYALGTSVIADDNVIAGVLGSHNFTLAMVLIVSPTPLLALRLVDGAARVVDGVFPRPPPSAP